MRCVTCRSEAAIPIAITENVHDMHCPACLAAWLASPEFALVEQLLGEGRKANALSQYRNFQSRMARQNKVAA